MILVAALLQGASVDAPRHFYYEAALIIMLSLGTALFIAGLIGLTVDRFNARALEAQVQEAVADVRESVMEAVLEQLVPSEIVDQIMNSVLRVRIVRSYYSVFIVLEENENNADILNARITIHQELRNLTNKPWRYDMKAFSIHGPENSTRFVSLSAEGPNGRLEYDAKQLANDMCVHRKDGISLKEIEIPLAPRQGEPTSVELTIERTYHARDKEVWAWYLPVQNLQIHVQHPLSVSVSATGNFSSEGERARPSEGRGYVNWRVEGGFLPYQSVQITWAPVGSNQSAHV